MNTATDLLAQLVAIPSVNPSLEADGCGEAEIAHFCAERLAEFGLEVTLHEVAEGRFNVVATHGSGSPHVLLNGHLDTVGVAGMTTPPFEPLIRDGRLHGRGACDMKAGVAALMEAARRTVAAHHQGTLTVALTCDEEHASIGMARLVEGGLAVDEAIVCEPTDLAIMPAHKGFVWVEARFRGRAAHGSRPDQGVDAIRHAAAWLASLDELDEQLAAAAPHPLLGHGSVHAGTIEGGSAASVYPEHCRVVIERRTLPGEGETQVMDELHALTSRLRSTIPELDVELRPIMTRPGTEVDAAHRLVGQLQESSRALGHVAELRPMTAWVDAAFLNEVGVPAVCFGPGSIAQAHAADEWVELEQVERCAAILERYLVDRLLVSTNAPPAKPVP